MAKTHYIIAVEAVLPAPTPDDYEEVAAVTGRVFVAATPEQFTYDADGNMLSDGRFRYTWNAENRLVLAQELCAPSNRFPYTVSYAYDHKGRMVSKRITENDGNDTLVSNVSYIWDGWNIIRETQVSGLGTQAHGLTTNVTDNVWGLDLDGTLQGAGGVGGLLAVVRDGDTYIPTYDANGNVSEYVDTNGVIVAHYDYSPFGETLMQTGDLAASFTHRFSTKPWCPVTGLCEYQMRKYRPEIGRWLSRDPIEENSDQNLYLLVHNSTPMLIDKLGMVDGEKCCKATMCHWTGTISGNLIVPIYVGGWANIAISAVGVSDDAPNCFWQISGEGHQWIPGGGMAAGWIKGAISINMDAPCEWPAQENEEGTIGWVGVGGSIGTRASFSWAAGRVGSLMGTDWFGIGGINIFVGGGGFRANLEIKRGKGRYK